nr:CcdB family protein [uncultured Rhodopila sp.]
MMQLDLFANPNRGIRPAYPLIVLLQAPVVDGKTRVVAPLIPATVGVPVSRSLPLVEHHGQRYAVAVELVTNLPARLLRHPVGSIAQYRDDLIRAMDWLFCGI